METWLSVPGYDGYEVSDCGRVRSTDRIVTVGQSAGQQAYDQTRKGSVLKPWLAGIGYRYVSLGRGRKIGVHRLVALAFHGPPPNAKSEAAHLNGDYVDNRPDNLAWKTRLENEADKIAHGRSSRAYLRRTGEDHGNAKLAQSDVDAIRASDERTAVIAGTFGVSPTTIRRIKRGVIWRLAGG